MKRNRSVHTKHRLTLQVQNSMTYKRIKVTQASVTLSFTSIDDDVNTRRTSLTILGSYK